MVSLAISGRLGYCGPVAAIFIRSCLGTDQPMKICSLNTENKLNSVEIRDLISQIVSAHNIDILLIQEPWSSNVYSGAIGNLVRLGGVSGCNSQVCTWGREPFRDLRCRLLSERIVELVLDRLSIFDVYLPSRKSERKERIAEVNLLASTLVRNETREYVVMGDFNLAPRPMDAIYMRNRGGNHVLELSPYTKQDEQDALQTLLTTANLVDMGGQDDEPVWTRIYSTIKEEDGAGGIQKWRGDLALVSKSLAPRIPPLAFDHSTRYEHASRTLRRGGFTQHSALIVEIPFRFD